RLSKRHGAPDSLRNRLEESVRAPFARRSTQLEDQKRRRFWALKDVSFKLAQGEVMGLIGPNGAGKSVLLKILSRITKPTEGRARVRGQVGVMLDGGAGFHPELSGRENIFLSGALLGMSRASITRQLDAIVCFSGLEEFLHMRLKRYSSGMQARLALAVAAHLDTQILLVDEALSLADDAFREACVGKLRQAAAAAGKTIILVSHDLSVIERLCHRAVLLMGGRVVIDDSVRRVVSECPGAFPAPGSQHADRVARTVSLRSQLLHVQEGSDDTIRI